MLRAAQNVHPQTAERHQGGDRPSNDLSTRRHLRLTPPSSIDIDPSTQSIKLYPDIALALLRERLVAPGRLWLLLRFIDSSGRGWIAIDEARRQLTKKESPLRTVGWRQMRKLFARGDGLFWERDSRRIWLRSPLKVAASMRVNHLTFRPVGLPVTELLQSIGQVRAHFYASFHSGRIPEKAERGRAAPIARATLQALCQASRRTQRAYERRAGVQKQRNFAIGRPLAVADHQNQAWARGRAVFRISDRDGRAGREGATYTAWQLPNSYSGPHEKQPKGRQKRMNRKLADLFMKGMTGNGEREDQASGDGERRFFDSGAAATAKYNRSPDGDIYWPCRQRAQAAGGRRSHLWHWLPPQSERQNSPSTKLAQRGSN